MLQACFPDIISFDFGYDPNLAAALEDILESDLEKRMELLGAWHGIKFQILVAGVTLTIVLPSRYPEDVDAIPTVSLSAPGISGSKRKVVEAAIETVQSNFNGYELVLDIVMAAQEAMQSPTSTEHVEANSDDSNIVSSVELELPSLVAPRQFGRRLIHSHHIINPKKRQVVSKWALELGLGGYSKIGWPGIIVIEGPEDSCEEYVKRIKSLRWKYIVVKGQHVKDINSEIGETVDSLRAFHKGFEELGEGDMSVLAARCREANLEELFKTCMS